MTATTHLPIEEQYGLVYTGICAVASNCDGAHEQDGVGFNGQDTKFGKRIASVPFSEWTPEIKDEAARIAVTYRAQIERYIGVDITALPVVQEAQGLATSYGARDQARDFERKAKAAAKRVAKILDSRTVSLSFPYDADLVSAVRALPGRKWDSVAKVWTVDQSQATVAFIKAHGFTVLGGADLLDVPAEAPAPAEPVEVKPNVVLDKVGVRISFDYDAGTVAGVRRLPGRSYDGSTKTNTADLHPEVLAFADEFNLVVDPAVVEAINNLEATKAATQTEAQIRRQVSALADPAALPAEFAARVLAACPKAKEA